MSDPGETRFYRILVAVETDATQYYGADAARPGLLDSGQAEQMLAHIAADLEVLLPRISRCSLIAPGALFDQTQVLRPCYPAFRALEAVPAGRGRFAPRLVSIGAEDGAMPVTDLQPLADIPLGLLQLLPLVVHGPAGLVDELGQAMEYRFMEEGQLSAHSAKWLESAFGITVNHARLMTLTDLNAMLRMQLDHFGFLPLWELLDAALTGRAEPLKVETPGGQAFEWRDGTVHATLETFDHWAANGGGSGLDAGGQALAAAYGDRTREARQYLTTLKAHGVELGFHRPARVHRDQRSLEGTFLTEFSRVTPAAGASAVTEHSHDDLGTIAITAIEDGALVNYYPLSPGGLNDIHDHLRRQVPGGQTVAFPGRILYDEERRALVPDSGSPPAH